MRVAYIAHPISGDVKENLNRVKAIARGINLFELDVVPFAPYYLDCVCLDDNDPSERARGLLNDRHLLESGIVDELRLYGNRISEGMYNEIAIALVEQIEIVPMSPETTEEYQEYLNQ